MTTDVELTKDDAKFLDACRKVQGIGLYPSAINLMRHTDFRLKDGQRIAPMRDAMVRRGLLDIATNPAAGFGNGRRLSDDERLILMRLAHVTPPLELTEVHRRFVAEIGRPASTSSVSQWVKRFRDAATLTDADGPRHDETAIRAKIHAELRAAITGKAERILGLERERATLARIDTLPPREACKVILRDWNRRFATRKQPADTRPARFLPTAYRGKHESRRMERHRGTTCRLRHSPYGMEAGVG